MFRKSTPRKVTITYVCAESSWNRVFPIAGWNCRVSLIKKGPRNDQDNCSLSSAFNWVTVIFVPFHTSVEKYQSDNKRYNSIETVSLLVTAHLNLSKAFASICPSILLNKLGTMNMCECPELVPKLSYRKGTNYSRWNINILAVNCIFFCVRGTKTQPLICVGCSVHCWVSCAINKGSFFEIEFSSSTHFCLALRRLVTFCLTLTN